MIRTTLAAATAIMLSMTGAVVAGSNPTPTIKRHAESSQARLDNKALTRAIIDTMWNRKNPEEAAKMLAPDYREHMPGTTDPSVKGFVESAKALLVKFPNVSATIHKLIGEGDLVAAYVHWKPVPNEPGFATADFFQFRDGKLIAHWGVVQPVAGDSQTNGPSSIF